MNLKETKEHIERVANGCPSLESSVALLKIDEKIKEDYIKKWAILNKDELMYFIEFLRDYKSVKRFMDKVELIKKRAAIVENARINKKSHTFELVQLIKKINEL